MGLICSTCSPELEREYFDYLGVLQIKIEQKVFYGVGVFAYPYFITLTRYYAEGATLRVCILNSGETTGKVRLPITTSQSFSMFQVKEGNIREAQLFGDHKMFMRLTLSPISSEQAQGRFMRSPELLRDRMQVRNCKGFAIGLPNFQKMELSAKDFELKHISMVRLQYSAALLFIKTDRSVYLYGFYDNVNGFGSEDYYLSSQDQIIQQAILGRTFQNESYTLRSHQRQVADSISTFPYNSIGLLRYQGLSGTAAILFSKKKETYKYLITCAHNFYRYNKDFNQVVDQRSRLASYSFILLSDEVSQQPDRFSALKQQQNFRISKVYIPKDYIDSVDAAPNKTETGQAVTFQFSSQNTFKKLQMNDIAIVQLENQIKFPNGFRVNLFQKPFNLLEQQNIEVSGFPRNREFDRIYEKQYTSSTSDCTETTRTLVQLSDRSSSNSRIIRHQLSTLPGNSGSPIYEHGGHDSKVYLFGVHTGGGTKIMPKEAHFVKLSEEPTYGHKIVHFSDCNRGTYLYSKSIYKWLLSLPRIHTVTDHYEKLISQIAILELGSQNHSQFGIGLLINLNHITFSSSYSQIKKVYLKRYEIMREEENILAFNLQEIDKFRVITNYQVNSETSQFGLKSFHFPAGQAYQSFQATKHAKQLSASDRQTIQQGKALGLMVSLTQSGKDQLKLVVEPFQAESIFRPYTSQHPVILFVYDFTNNVLIWSTI